MAPGKFDDHTHEQLQKMIASGTPDKISAHAQTLESAAQIIAQASAYVDSVVSRLEWKGEAAQAYRSWATQFAKEGNKLSEYAQSVGTALSTAGQALNETKSGMPNAGSESAWREETMASPGAEVSREKARQEAIQRMERLDSYYAVASEQIRDTKEPTFKARALDLPPAPSSGSSGATPDGAQQAAANVPAAQSTGGPLSQTSLEKNSVAPSQVPHSLPTVEARAPLPDSQVRTDLNSVDTVPDVRPSPSGNVPTQSAPTGTQPASNSPSPSGPSVIPPVTAGRPGGISPGHQQSGGTTSGQAGGISRGSNPLQPPVSPGIHGGRASHLPSSPTQAGMARGTVIGAEPGRQGRPTGGGYTPGVSSSGIPTTPGGSQQGSRRDSRPPGGTAHKSSSPTSPRREFTPGGTGLVQGGTPLGSPRGTGQAGQERRNSEQRPGYLREKAATWGDNRRRIVPPVID